MISRVPAIAFLLFCVTAAWAQESKPVPTPPSFSVSVNLIKVPFSVFDGNGNMVNNLQREDFRIWEDGALQQIRSFGMDTNPVSVVLVLDTSATVKSELDKLKAAAEAFAASLSRGDRISVVAFDEEVKLILDWTSDMKQVRQALRKVDLGMRTALYDAMYIAAHDQLQNVEGRKAIILLTDCLNNQSSLGFSDASLSVVQSQASLYVISKTAIVRKDAQRMRRVVMLSDIYKRLFGDHDYIEEFFRKREAEMTDLAEKTGGRCFFPTDYGQIKGVYAEVARELKSKYFLTYVSNQTGEPNSYHNISLEYLPQSTKLTFRKGYYFEPNPIRRPR
jgi:Ca-activated chloride channel family protein